MTAGHAMMGDVATDSSSVIVGRDSELDDLAAWLGAGEDRPRATSVLVSGDAGVGKTRLLTETRDRLVAAGWRVVAGHCLDLGDSGLPYLPFSEILGRLATELPEVVAEATERHPMLARLQPGRRTLGGASEEGATVERSSLFEAVRALLEDAAGDAPLLVVVEDVHWADQSTRDLLTYLFTRDFSTPASLVASYRADDLHRRHPLRPHVAEWARLPAVRRLGVVPLAEDAVQQLIDALAPEGLGVLERTDIVHRAEGNAFLVEELISAVADPGRSVPADLAEVLLVRLDRLDDTARHVVRAASVAGGPVTHELLAAASGLEQEVLDLGLRLAVEMNVLVASGTRYRFRHALLGEAVYDDLLPGERVRLHAAFAAALEAGDAAGTAAELARHSRLANDLETALHASIRAGHDALGVGGPDEAAKHYQQALALVSEPERPGATDVDRAALVVHLADALTAAGRPQRAAALLTEELAALPATAPDGWRARLVAARAFLLLITETEEHPLDVSAEAVALAPVSEPGVRARALAVHARVLTTMGRLEEAEPYAVEGLALADRHNLPDLASDLAITLSQARHTGPRVGLREALADAIGQARATGATGAELRAHFMLGRSFEDHAEWDRAAAAYQRGIDRAEEIGTPYAPYGFECRWHLGFGLLVRGEWDAVLDLVARVQRAPRVPRALLRMLGLQVQQRRGEDVAEQLPPLREFWREEGLIAIHSSAMEMADGGRAGDPARVLAAYDDVVAVLSRLWHPWFSARIRLGAVAIGALAETVPRLSAEERSSNLALAQRLHDDGHLALERHPERGTFWGPEGQAWVKRLDAELLRMRWLVAEPPPLESLVAAWRETEALFETFGDVHELAAVRTVLAGVLRAAGEHEESRGYADRARAAAESLGARPLLDELRDLGSRPARHSVASTALTGREREILALVAAGHSNGEIGKRLFIATKTASVHVSNILAKLGASSRTEAAAIARRRGLLD